MRRWLLPLLLLLAVPPTPVEALSKREARKLTAEAREHYDQGQFGVARPLLERLDEGGDADGPSLYRLAFCLRQDGETDAAQAVEARAVGRLEAEVADAETIETAFYLANAYRNAERTDDAERVAREALDELESGDLRTAEDPSAAFRVGKLYADVGRTEPATEWFVRLLEPDADGEVPEHYVRWASRYLADRANDTGDLEGYRRHLARFVEAGGEPAGAEVEQLAVARFRQGSYGEAAQLWNQVLGSSPADPDRYRYASRLARMAEALGELPGTAPDGRAWEEMTREELESLMRDQSERARETVREAQEIDVLTRAHRKALRADLRAIKPNFVAAALEYTVRGLPIRETAFFGGYAPLIFRAKAWRLMRPADESAPDPATAETGSEAG